MEEKQIFSCDDINWKEVEELFEEMRGERPKGKVEEGLLSLDLALIKDHVASCPKCEETLVRLAEEHGVTKGIIFQEESESEESR